MAPFEYFELLQKEIRLVELQPGSPDDLLAGTILHRHFSPAEGIIPSFEALSYAWGNQSNPVSISLVTEKDDNGLQASKSGNLHIGQNLASALRSLRNPLEPRILWCDSICINQNGIDERAAQVQRMHKIFHYARSVIVWMGPETQWSVLLMDTLRWVGTHVENASCDIIVRGFRFKFADTPDQCFRGNYNTMPLSTDQWRAVEQFLSLDWIKRLWTCQEIILANQETSVVRIGREEMPWAKLKDVVTFICYYGTTPSGSLLDPQTYVFNAKMFQAKMLTCGYRPWDDWITPLNMLNGFQCTDDRDRVFAVYGLVEPEASRAIKADYTKTTKELFTSICLSHIKKEKNLSFLTLCNASTSPTWVADLNEPIGIMSIDNHAGAGSPLTVILSEPDILEVAGVVCDGLCRDPIPLPKIGLTQLDAEYIQTVADVFNKLANDDLFNNIASLNNFIEMLTFGGIQDHFVQEAQGIPFLEDWHKTLRRWVIGPLEDESLTSNLAAFDRSHIASMAAGTTSTGCSKTTQGSFIRVPSESLKGDLVAVILGSSNPMILRPQERPGYYSVIGPCYHPEFAHREALLGNDFQGWMWRCDRTKPFVAFSKEGEPSRRTDPRLDHVPLDFSEGWTEQLITEDEIPCWGVPGQGRFSFYDPRMSEEQLKKRGVPIQRLKLV
ncbi:heterokaryon incompatibility protein het-6 [Fusarium heterosporum]|uniref:Heterokaryon incompatibility protein het-6 n=1 Tax=Fusarium heterosporum TaxID=42747 RepID=A0A8H5T5G2_FUSHE|nr:heterokaryon incompatibility protein het-6 [Fusarium heterosporum]